MTREDVKIGLIGLGYVGLPLALAFGRKFSGTIGFDINVERVESLRSGVDPSGETSPEALASSDLAYTTDPKELSSCNFFVIGVPTPVDQNHTPDLGALRSASKAVGEILSSGSIVVYESTVYPGVTEDVCGPALEEASGLKCGVDFKLGYSPERINPGDSEHVLEKVVKIVSGQDEETLETVADVYSAVVEVGVHKAPSIKVAEAAKVIENTQRDLNIALMNELAIIFDLLGISTSDVLAAAQTKWNFLKFVPGLVGGHCIGVDPYYLTTMAEQYGYHPQVILAGRRINDGMGRYIAQRTVKMMVNAGMPIVDSRVGILGATFKENVSDIRNSRVPDIVHELHEFGYNPVVYDPHANPDEMMHEYQLELCQESALRDLDALIFAVPHTEFVQNIGSYTIERLKPNGILIDVKSIMNSSDIPSGMAYWSL